MHSAQVPTACQRFFGDDTVYVFDGGNATVWASFFSEINRPDTLLSTFKFGMLGAGVSQALAGQIAKPDSKVVCIIGDGAMGFHFQELETALRNELPVIYLVLCDKQWGMVKLTQSIALGMLRPAIGTEQQGTINADFEEIAFDKVAEAMGCHGERVSDPAELEGRAPTLRRLRQAVCRSRRRGPQHAPVRSRLAGIQGDAPGARSLMGAGPAVLVTGAAGYVGRLCVAALCERLGELSALVALDWTEVEPSEQIAGVVYEQGDICDPALKDLFREHGIDTVVHLASIVRAPKGAPADLAYRVDVSGHEKRPRSVRGRGRQEVDRHVERRGVWLSP